MFAPALLTRAALYDLRWDETQYALSWGFGDLIVRHRWPFSTSTSAFADRLWRRLLAKPRNPGRCALVVSTADRVAFPAAHLASVTLYGFASVKNPRRLSDVARTVRLWEDDDQSWLRHRMLRDAVNDPSSQVIICDHTAIYQWTPFHNPYVDRFAHILCGVPVPSIAELIERSSSQMPPAVHTLTDDPRVAMACDYIHLNAGMIGAPPEIVVPVGSLARVEHWAGVDGRMSAVGIGFTRSAGDGLDLVIADEMLPPMAFDWLSCWCDRAARLRARAKK